MPVITSKQSFWQQKNNNANYGFFPTDLKIVEMEMKLIDFSKVTNGKIITLSDFTGGEGEQLAFMHQYVKEQGLNPFSYYNEISELRYKNAKEKYSNIENFNMLNSDFFYMKCVNKEGERHKKNNIAIIRNNPPYIWIERYGISVRAEEEFFIENTFYNIPGGIQILELPQHQLLQIPTLLSKICFRYEKVNIFKFPKKEHEKFKQVVVIGQKKRQNSNDGDIAKYWIERIKNDDLKYLDEVEKPIYEITDEILEKIKPITVFKDIRITEQSLTLGLNTVIDSLINAERSTSDIKKIEKDTPIIEKLTGHIAQELAAGKYNGIMGNVLVRGGVKKEIIKKENEDEDGNLVIEETEVLKPFIEITNSEGEIIFKEN